ncbi:MAG: endonuclease/exonuclease/phosphatase family protein [Planctomycetota bacterium]
MPKIALLFASLLLLGCSSGGETVRFATFNSALSREAPGELLVALSTPDDEQAQAVAAIIQAARPDVLVLQEFDHGGDYDPDGEALRLFQENYLRQPQACSLRSIQYKHVYLVPSNTGIPTGVDLNGDGLVAPTEGAEVGTDAYAGDCHGWGKFPGQYAFVVLSKFPIDREGIETSQERRWFQGYLPDELAEAKARTKEVFGWSEDRIDRWYAEKTRSDQMPIEHFDDEAKRVLRLSSKNHVEVPIRVGLESISVVTAHPTPPVFDGPEDRNGRRNHDELVSLLSAVPNSAVRISFSQDATDLQRVAGYASHAERYVVMGDLNADPNDGEVFVNADGERAIDTLISLRHWGKIGIIDPMPTSPGGVAAAERQGGVNADHIGDPAADTADWNDDPTRGPGNLRVDYVLPSADLEVVGSGVFWPTPDEPLMGVDLATAERASDHRLVWVDVKVD